MARSKASGRWLQEHFADPYVKEAQKMGYRSRAAFKLLEIQQKDSLIKPGMIVVDLGAAPGGWSQIVAHLVGEQGRVLALDILPMDGIVGVEFVVGDFREVAVLQQFAALLKGQQPDLVISDMAPNISGNDSIDQPRALYLVELALDFSRQYLRKDGNFLVKVFHGAGFDAYFKEMKQLFKKVITRKPTASRSRSSEVYLLGLGKL